jgi:hypothetical protein
VAVAMLFENPEGSKEQYQEFSRKMFGGKDAPDEPIQGLIIHTAGQTERGFRIFDVWESRADYERFMNEYVEPAMEGDMTPEQMQQMPQPEVYELANVEGVGIGATA